MTRLAIAQAHPDGLSAANDGDATLHQGLAGYQGHEKTPKGEKYMGKPPQRNG
jgi:hypothetical protein